MKKINYISLKNRKYKNGYLLILILVFGAIFFLIVTAFFGFVITQKKVQVMQYNKERALNIAEAGLDYYRWYLAHNPDDTTAGTGLPGPYVFAYSDPESGPIGEYSLSIASTSFCGDIQSIDITSTGHTYVATSTARTVTARYTRPTVADFSLITNSNIWFSGGTIIGAIHANGGIRMDAGHNAVVSSGQSTWLCDASFSCSPDQTVNGVFGSGQNSSLWLFPSPPINFTGLAIDLSVIEDKAKNKGGTFISNSGEFGYRLNIRSDNKIDVYKVKKVKSYWAWKASVGWFVESNIIDKESFVNTYTINQNCPVIFVEDKVWLEGNVASKMTLAAADVNTSGVDYSMVIEGNINYTGTSSGLLAIAESDVDLGVDIPETMNLSGIFVSQNGRFGRNYILSWLLPNGFSSKAIIDQINFLGTLVSKERAATAWVDGNGYVVSGIVSFITSYDQALVDDPPPFTPNSSDDYKFIRWLEVE